MQKSRFPKRHHCVGFLQTGSQLVNYTTRKPLRKKSLAVTYNLKMLWVKTCMFKMQCSTQGIFCVLHKSFMLKTIMALKKTANFFPSKLLVYYIRMYDLYCHAMHNKMSSNHHRNPTRILNTHKHNYTHTSLAK